MPSFPLISTLLSSLRDLLLIVFLSLGSIWFALKISHYLRKGTYRTPPQPTSPPPPKNTPPPTALAADPGIPPPARTGAIPHHHLAVIAAAIHHLYRGQARLAGVSHASSAESRWAHEGRRDIFTSHRIR